MPNFIYGQMLYKYDYTTKFYYPFRYRIDPVPRIYSWQYYFKEFRHRPKLLVSSYRNCFYEIDDKWFKDIKAVYRFKAAGYCDHYDDYIIYRKKTGWKDKKIKHQWQKNIKSA